MGQDQQGDAGDFPPYQPDATPDGERTPNDAEAPPAKAPPVPYGGDAAGKSAAPVSRGRRWLPWIVGGAVLAWVGYRLIGGLIGIYQSASDPDVENPASPVESSASDTIESVPAADLESGQCVTTAGFGPDTDEREAILEVVPCSNPHDAEVVAVNVLDPEETATLASASHLLKEVGCRDHFTAAQRDLLYRGDLYLIALADSREPAEGDQVACLLTREDGEPLRESLSNPKTKSSD